MKAVRSGIPFPARLALPALLTLLSLLAGCDSDADRLAGGGGVDVEGITVEGTALRADRTPVAGARVRLRSWDFQKSPAAPKRSLEGGDTRTDSLGRFRFQDVDTGRYALEVDAGEDGATVLEIEADGSKRILTLEALVQPLGSLAGEVRDEGGSPIAGSRIGVLGLDRETLSDSGGRFELAGLPPGVYTLRIQPPSRAWSSVEVPLVEVPGGARTVLPAIILLASAPDLLAQWRFDEGKGSIAADALGSQARAVLRGDAGWAAAREGSGLSLPASGTGYAFVPKTKSSALDLDSGADFTLTVWIRTASPDAGSAAAGTGAAKRVLDSRTDYAPNGYALGLAPDGGVEFLARALGSDAEVRIAGGTGLDDGEWHTLIAGRSGTRFFLYADGSLLGESQGPSTALTRANALYFGSREGKDFEFPGLIDDVRIYSRAFTAEEAGTFSSPPPP